MRLSLKRREEKTEPQELARQVSVLMNEAQSVLDGLIRILDEKGDTDGKKE